MQRIALFLAPGNNQPRLGFVEADQLIDLGAAAGTNDLTALIGSGPDWNALAGKARASGARVPVASAKFLPPVPDPRKIICLGLNYADHAKEGGHARPEYPSIFLRVPTSLVGHGQGLVRPRVSDKLDYEAELVLVVSKRARHLTPANALDAVAGYSCFNDGSLRDYQRKTNQWTIGKNFDATGAFGPWFVPAADLPPGAVGLKIESRLNGEVMQSDNTSNMLFPVVETLCLVTEAITLEPGDLIVMGTPSGVGYARKPPVWMKAGDKIEIEIEGIGVLSNPVVDEE
ncbi:MAG: 5-oxopent-3-ene,2,5-tricarboxylate decarboxylase [Ramlibacter sp.]|jgi:acylpyruvate hydrolase|nr:5-oxopent-3-ene,2,5-tricarboxylate decarboxylase [Ramlibacter sp.]